MITANEEMLLLDMITVKVSLQAKARVQTSMAKDEKELINEAANALENLEIYYKTKKLTK